MQSSITQCNTTYYRTEASTGASETAIGDSVYRQTHNLKVAGSNPAPATTSSPWEHSCFRGFLILGTLLPFVESTLNQHMPLGVDDRRHRGIPTHPAPRPGQSLGHRRQEAGRPSHRPAASGASPTGASSIAVSTCPRRTPKGSARCSSTPRARWKAESWPRSGRGSAPGPRSSSPISSSWCRWTHECRTGPCLRVRRFARGDHGQGPGRDDLPSGVRVGRAGRRHPPQLPVPRRYGVRSLPCRTVRRSLCCGAIGNRLPPEHLREPWGVCIDIAA